MPETTIHRAARRLATGLAVALALLASAAFADPDKVPVRRVEELRYPPLPAFEIPLPERVVLANGLRVLLIEDHELPLVRAIATFPGGTREDQPERRGLATLATEVMRTGGAGERGADELDDYLEAKAANIEAGASRDLAIASMNCLAGDFPAVLAAFAEVLRRPRFAEERLAVAKNDVYSTIARQNDDPQGILFRELDEILFGEDSRLAGQPTFASVAGIGRDDLAAWHRFHVQPQVTILGLVGDFDRASALALVRQAFEDWQPAPLPKEAFYVPGEIRPPAPAVHFAEKPDVTQSSIALGTIGIRKDNPDLFAVDVLNQVMGGSFGARLFANIRTRKGLAYSVSGQIGSDYDHQGRTVFFLSTKTETTGAAIDALYEEIRNLIASQPPSDEEVAKAKGSILNSFVFNADTPQEVLSQQVRYERYGFPRDFLTRYRTGIEKVTTADVVAAAKRYLHPEELVLLVVGPSQGLDKPLSTYGTVTPRDITIPPFPGQGGE